MSTCDILGVHSYKTTYKECYDAHTNLPPILYHQQPAIEYLNNGSTYDQLAPRQFPLIPSGPHRRRARGMPPLGPGLGTPELDTQKFIGKKPIIQTEPPVMRTTELEECEEEKRREKERSERVRTRSERLEQMAEERASIPREAIKRLTKDVTLSSTTRKFLEEAALPIRKFEVPTQTWELNSDMVKLRPRKYEQRVEQWQQVAGSWDRAQNRAPTGPRRSFTEDHRYKQSHPRKLLTKRQTKTSSSFQGQNMNQLIQDGRLAAPYVPQTPGYAGFLPRSPIDAIETKQEAQFTSLMKDSYKSFPTDEYQIQTFHHKGPLSRTVTLTYPYNPFKKM